MFETILSLALAASPFGDAGAPRLRAAVDISFKYWENMPKFYEFLKYCLGATVILCIIVGLSKLIVYLVRRVTDRPVEIRDEDLMEVLRNADRQRSRFDLMLGNVKPIPCALRTLESSQLTLEAPSYIKLSKKFIGRDIRCFFKTRATDKSKKPGDNFYFFYSQILDVEVAEDEIKFVTVSLPALLSTGQKRDYFRYSPPKAYVIEFAAWPETLQTEYVHKMPQPRCQLEGEADFKGYLVNISAGGMLMDIDRMYIVRSGMALDVGKAWLIRLTLLGLNNDLLRIWFVGRLMTVLDTGVGKFQLAFRFVKFARHPEEQATLEWRLLTPDGVPPIASWILKRSVDRRPED